MKFSICLLAACFVCLATQAQAQQIDGKPDRLVIAHHMTRLIYYADHEDGDLISNAHFSPNGPSGRINGMLQTYPLAGQFLLGF